MVEEKILRKKDWRPLDEVRGEGTSERFQRELEEDLKPFLNKLEQWRKDSLYSKLRFDTFLNSSLSDSHA